MKFDEKYTIVNLFRNNSFDELLESIKNNETTSTILVLFIIFIMITSCNSVLDSSRIAVYEEVIEEVLNEPLPKLEIGKTGKVNTNGVEIWYELISTPEENPKGTIVLVEGLTATGIRWGEYFYAPLLKEGYTILRFDNRDVGNSSWINKADYDLSDMANDLPGLIDELKIDSIHLVGQSMGGMIVQEFALSYPERLKTLTLIYTSGYFNDEELPEASEYFIKAVTEAYLKYGSSEITDMIKSELITLEAANGSPLNRADLKYISQCVIYEKEKRSGFNKKASKNQENAIEKSGSRYERLYQIKIPTLIIHGEDDMLINIEHGKKLATLIPHSKTVWVENHGHHTSISFSNIITKNLLKLIEKLKN